MSLSRLMLALLALGASGLSLAGNLTTSSNITVLAVDGQNVKSGANIQLSDNQVHQLVVEASGMIGSNDNQELFESQPLIVRFEGVKGDLHLSAPSLSSQLNVDEFNEKMAVKLSANGQEVAVQKAWLKGEGFMPNADIAKNLVNFNASKQPASVAEFVANAPIVYQQQQQIAALTGENQIEKNLQYLFQQADNATRQRFLNWAKAQPNK